MFMLLWIELLLAALLWVGFALAGKSNRPIVRYAEVFSGFFVPGIVLGGLTGVCWKFCNTHIPIGWFRFTGSLLVAWLVISVLITVYGLRRGTRQRAPAENWPRVGLAAATAMTLIVVALTLIRIDAAALSHASATRASANAALVALSPPAQPDADNAADVYSHAFAQIKADPTFEQEWSDSAHTETDPASIHALLLRRADSIVLFRLASKMPYCRFDHDYSKATIVTTTPELSSARRGQWLMQLAVSDALAEGKTDAAAADLAVMFRMSRQIPQMPSVVGGLVRSGMEEMAIKSLMKVLPALNSTRQVDALDIGPADYFDTVLPRSLAGEEALGIGTISDFITSSASRRHAGNDNTAYFALPIGAVVRMYLAWDLDSYCAYMGEVQKLSSRPWIESHIGAEGPPPPIMPGGFFSSLLRIEPGKIIRTFDIAQARHESALLAVAVARYRIEHGKLPDRLADLVPGELAALPDDPFTSKPMLLAKQKDQWIIYSAGPNGKDDGGAEYDRRTQAGDVGFTLRLAASAATQPATR